MARQIAAIRDGEVLTYMRMARVLYMQTARMAHWLVMNDVNGSMAHCTQTGESSKAESTN
jgi:hypothetical protein